MSETAAGSPSVRLCLPCYRDAGSPEDPRAHLDHPVLESLTTWHCEKCGRKTSYDIVIGGAITKTGKLLTDKDFEELADEAEKGYDVRWNE